MKSEPMKLWKLSEQVSLFMMCQDQQDEYNI